MKLAIVTITNGVDFEHIADLTHPGIREYARKCGAEFICWEPAGPPYFEKFKIFDLLEEFDRVLYIDTDVLVRPDAPNLFEIVPPDQVGLLEEGEFQPREGLILNLCQALGLSSQGVDQSRYFNTGVMLVSKEHKGIFAPWPTEFQPVDQYMEQTYLNYRIAKLRPPVFCLDHKFNWMGFFINNEHRTRTDGHFIHYAGLHQTLPLKEMLRRIEEDKERVDPTFTKTPEKIAIKVDGGLGDHVSAEPAIRFLRDHIYPKDDLIVISHYPDVFEHLDMPNHLVRQAFIEDANERQVLWSFPAVDHPIWKTMSHALVNAYDYAAIALTRGELPVGHRSPTLHPRYKDSNRPEFPLSIFPKTAELMGDWSRVVLVHPGRGWESKTFPPDVWRSYVDAILLLKLKPVLIGKRMAEDQGVVEFDTEGTIDLIDKLSLQELIGAIATAPVLLSNDSAPIHLAGAFQNRIGVIATCKRPEFILPYRTDPKTGIESNWWRAWALERAPLYDKYLRKPTLTGQATMEHCTEEEMRAALPPAGDIVGWLRAIHPALTRTRKDERTSWSRSPR